MLSLSGCETFRFITDLPRGKPCLFVILPWLEGFTVTSALDWITRLVSLDTTSRRSNLELIGFVAQELQRLGLTPVTLPNQDGTKANLVVTIPAHDGSTDGGVALSGHSDCVPVEGQDWDSDPFMPQIRDGRLFGRGTADMKSFVGAVMASLPALVQTPLREPVHLLLSHDEEVGCLGGEQMVKDLARLNIQPAMCIVGEPTGMRVIAAHKSINVFELAVTGVAAHSSRTPHGVNAIEYTSRAVAFIRSLADDFRDNGPYDMAYDVPYTTASVNTITGGVAENIVPDRCQVKFEFRSISAVDPNEVRARIQTYCQELQKEMRLENPQARVDLRSRATVPGLETDATSPAVQLGAILGGEPSASKVTYGTEGGLYKLAGMDTIVCGPGEIAQAHTANEFVELDQIQACETFIHNLVLYLSTSSPATDGTAR